MRGTPTNKWPSTSTLHRNPELQTRERMQRPENSHEFQNLGSPEGAPLDTNQYEDDVKILIYIYKRIDREYFI